MQFMGNVLWLTEYFKKYLGSLILDDVPRSSRAVHFDKNQIKT